MTYKVNGKKHYYELELRKLLFINMKKRRTARIYWRGCSESAKWEKDGTIRGIGRLGGREMAKPIIYKSFDQWFRESIIEEDVLNIEIKNGE